MEIQDQIKKFKAIQWKPNTFCDMIQPFKYQINPTTTSRWNDALEAIPNDKTVFSVDRIVAEHGVHRLKEYYQRNENIKKIQCICNYGNHFHLFQLAIHFRNLTGLNMYGIFLSDGGVWNLVKFFHKLEELVIRVDSQVKCRTLRKLYSNNPYLRNISIIGHRTKSCCLCLVAIPKAITHFSMFNCTYPKNFFVDIAPWSYLKCLRVDYCFYPPNNFISSVLNHKPKLDVFEYNFAFMKIGTVIECYRICNITTLKLINNMDVNDNILIFICKVCPKIEVLKLGHLNLKAPPTIIYEPLPKCMLTDKGLSQLQKLMHLSSLGLFGVYSTDDNNQYLHSLTCCANLESLSLTTQGSNITDIGCDVIRHCSKLTKLALMGYNFTNENMMSIRDELLKISSSDIRKPKITLYISTRNMGIHMYSHFTVFVKINISDDLIMDL